MKRILFVSINYIHNGCCNNHIHIVAFSLYRNVPVLCAGIFSWEIQLNFYSKRMTSKFETRVSKLEQLTSDNQQLLESVTATNFERLLAHSQGCSLSLPHLFMGMYFKHSASIVIVHLSQFSMSPICSNRARFGFSNVSRCADAEKERERYGVDTFVGMHHDKCNHLMHST